MTTPLPSAPVYSSADYAQAMANLLPRGPVWSRDPNSNMMALMGALAPTYQRNGAAAAQLIADIFPATTEALIPEWEETLGLPDPCSASNPSTQQRQAAILAKFIGSGGQSVPYFISVAAALGYTITITEFTPSFLGVMTFGSPLMGPGWESVWQVNAQSITVSYFEFGRGVFGDPFWSLDGAELQCRLNAIKPAHTLLIFTYGGDGGYLFNAGGVLTLAGGSAGYPTSATGLADGALWDAGGAVYVVPGVTPSPTAPAVFFNSISAASLLALGGGNLPLTDPNNAGQIWNNAGIACVSLG